MAPSTPDPIDTDMLRHLLLLSLIVLTSACQDQDSPSSPGTPPPLADEVWHVHSSDGQILPALLGHRLVNGSILEQDFLDSARVVVDDDGTWEHAAWYQRFHDGQYVLSASTLDWGTWTATATSYEFRRNTGELLYTVPGALPTDWRLNLRYPGQEGLAVSTLRRTPPPPSVAGRWRASTLNAQPLPAAYIVDPSVDFGTGPVSRHIVIDSAFVWLQANGSYRQQVFHTEWEGPAHGAPQVRVHSAVEADFGSWSTGGPEVVLESGWLQNKVIRGNSSGLLTGSIRLDHGISHGDPPAPFMYGRW